MTLLHLFSEKKIAKARRLSEIGRIIKGKFQCLICQRLLPTRRKLFKHVSNLHHPRGRKFLTKVISKVYFCFVIIALYHCSICNKAGRSKVALESHIRNVHNNGPFVCECKKIFKTQAMLRRHRTTV